MSAWQRIWRQIETLGLPILLALGIGFIFASPDQIHEVYRAAAQAFATSRSEQAADYRELICAAAGIFAVSLALWLAGRQIETAARDLQFGQAVQPGWVTQWIPRVLALVPPLAAAVGVTLARVSPTVESSIKTLMFDVFYEQFKTDGSSDVAARALATEAVSGLQSFNELLSIFSLCLIGGAALTLGIVWLLDYVSGIRDFLRPQRLYKSWVSLLFALFGFAIVIVFVTVPVELPQWIGIIGLLGLFLSFVLVAIAQLYSWGRQINTPLITILLLLALGFSAFDLNDNHTIRNSPTAVVRPPEPPKLDAAFERWFKSREDKDAFKERPYPIYVVAAQGGGIYAAHHVAGFLSDVQDLCPGFSHHLFAI
ncbi:MAG: hypothetical protein KDJ36_13600, partial [Hyphomicrobiaceae bacterium]|nr:hypothetical protein [Hyphomicrobiaceae bacterium]